MSNDLNQCNFIGRLGKDPEIAALQSGTMVANFSIAVGWKSKDKEGTEWVNVSAFGKLAEIIQQYVKKGSRVYISGKFKTDKYQAQDGSDRYSTKIIANQMQMLDSRQDNQQQSQHDKDKVNGYQPQNAPAFDDNSDIPF